METADQTIQDSWLRKLARALLMYVVPLVVVGLGAAGAVHVYQTGPKAKQRKPEQSAILVQVEPVACSSVRTVVEAMGTVIAAQEIIVQPRVSGEIVELNPEFVPGGRFKTGEVMLKIDPRDYELAVEQSRSRVAQAKYDLKMEQGAQKIAKREWELLGAGTKASELDQELALRKPHLVRVTAELSAAEAALHEAELNLERTTIRAPFNGIVTAENVDLGAQVAPQTHLGTLVGTDTYWVQASVPVDRLKWIALPSDDGNQGSAVRVYQQLGTDYRPEWEGRVLRLLGDLEPQGRMARVLVEVRDPLGLESVQAKTTHLLIGSYVNVEIAGKGLDHMISVPRTALRNGDSVWIMNDDKTLDIRNVSIAWRNRKTVVIADGVEADERLVVSDLPAPVAGMKLRVAGDRQDEAVAERLESGEPGEN